MSLDLHALCLDAQDPPGLAHFWAGVLGWAVAGDVTLRPSDDTGFLIRFLPTREPRTGRTGCIST